MTDHTLTQLLTCKTDLSASRIEHGALAPLAEGEALFRIDRVAVTTNNVTYAVMGDAMNYWDFFQTGVDGWGHMPAWGFADVIESKADGVAVGERFYGYFPIASHLRMQPVRSAARGFFDGTPHRKALTSAYNHYTRCATDPVYEKSLEDYQALLRPLIVTSFFCADFFQDNGFFGATQLLVSSASSKTAYGTAFCLAATTGVELIGLTSARNRAFVEQLDCYHRVVTYEELEGIPRVPTAYLDFAGDTDLRARVHKHFGDALTYDCVAGSAQNTDPYHAKGRADITGPTPTTYFAPTQIAKRNREWGYEEVNQRFGNAQRAFLKRVSDPEHPWMRVVEHRGFDAAASLITDIVRGRVDPQLGHIVTLG